MNSVVDWLLDEVDEGVADLREWMLLLPTRQAGRRLREALASEMNQCGGALFPPRTGTPWHLVRADEKAVASELACLWHWDRVLGGLNPKQFKKLFPRLMKKPDATWRRQMAQTLHGLRGSLAEGGLDCAAVATAEPCPEKARWQELKKLEEAYRNSLGQKQDLHDAKRKAAAKPTLVEGIRKIAVLGVPDLPGLVQTALGNCMAQGISVDVVVFGPKKGADWFDAWGRPQPGKWAGLKLTLEKENLVACLDEDSQAQAITQRLAAYGENRAQHVAVGVADPAVTPRLERALADADIAGFNPDGLSLRRSPLVAFLQALAELLRQPSFAHADALLRMPDAWGWAAGVTKHFSPEKLLHGLDELRTKHLPSRLDGAVRLHFEGGKTARRIHARTVLAELEKVLKQIHQTPLSVGLLEFLRAAFGQREFIEGRESDAADLESAKIFMDRLGEWEAATGDDAWPASEALALLIEAVGSEAVFAERRPEAVDIQGWLELAWEDAPHLMVAGANEGMLPESIRGDLFMPDALREMLGLRTNADRLARDAWLMELLVQTRARSGRVEFFIGRQRVSGNPLKPSRLLFRCENEQLAGRVKLLFDKLPQDPQPPVWSAPWKLASPNVGTVDHLSASAIRNYLECPYRFYLRKVLKMKPQDYEQRELDAMDFGSLVHAVLEAFGKNEEARKRTDAHAIQKFFAAELARQMEAKFGKRPPMALQVQQEIAVRRLQFAAHVQAAERAAGWEIVDTEKNFEKSLDGMKVIGWIDRIEKNRKTGAMRVLDYKTSNAGDVPMKKHWTRFKAGRDDAVPKFAQFKMNGKDHVWRDLQLFVYAWALGEIENDRLELGYFNLPAVGTGAGVALIQPDDAEIRRAAVDCARGVVAAVGRGHFWPPAPKLKYDDYEGILFNQPEISAAEPKGMAA